MNHWTRRIPFKVDIAGIIEIMGSSLYSRATTPIRELIQNAHDGIMRRRQSDLGYTGRIDIQQNSADRTIAFRDDGIGLSEAEAEQYLGTLGIGMTGLIKKAVGGGAAPAGRANGDGQGLIGQFGIGLFSAFMLADRLVVETRRADGQPAVRWEAGAGAAGSEAEGAGTDIEMSSCDREEPGTSVTLYLKPQHGALAEDARALEEAVKEYADFLPVPIYVNGAMARANLINAAWFDPTPERESIELELESFFHETALEVIPVNVQTPAPVAGALYVTPQRTPGFSSEPVVTVTVRRMVISRHVRGLLPPWASFLRGVLELNGCAPTASREDLVRDGNFETACSTLENLLFEHFEKLAQADLPRFEAVINWHRYTLAGAALTNHRLRELMRKTYPFATSQGTITFNQILGKSLADPLFESEAGHVIWYNVDRRQERWANALFAGHDAPCVHALRSFEESLLAAMAADAEAGHETQGPVALRPASPGSPSFAKAVLGVSDMEEADAAWQEFLAPAGAKVFTAKFDSKQPVMAFLNEKHELMRTFDELKKRGDIPAGFQRLIDNHFRDNRPDRNEVLLNRGHRLVARALSQKTSHPLASVLRLLVMNALIAAGAPLTAGAQSQQAEDLDWIAETLWGK